MDINAISELIANTGFSIVLMAYFLMKDWKFNQSILDVLSEVKEVLTELKTAHRLEDK